VEGKTEADARHYQSTVGSLSYSATATRPDIASAVSVISRYNYRPFTPHLTAAKRVLRYLKGTADLKLVFLHISITPVTRNRVHGLRLRRGHQRKRVAGRLRLPSLQRTSLVGILQAVDGSTLYHGKPFKKPSGLPSLILI